MKHLSGEEKWNRMITIISFLLYTTYVILAVLSLYFTSGPTPEDVALGGKFMLALAALVIAERLLSFPRLSRSSFIAHFALCNGGTAMKLRRK